MENRNSRLNLSLSCLAAVSLVACKAAAYPLDWTGLGGNDDFMNGNNWYNPGPYNTSFPPDPGSSVNLLDTTATAVATLYSGSVTINDFTLSANNGVGGNTAFTIKSGASLQSTLNFDLGYYNGPETVTFTLENGAIATVGGYFGGGHAAPHTSFINGTLNTHILHVGGADQINLGATGVIVADDDHFGQGSASFATNLNTWINQGLITAPNGYTVTTAFNSGTGKTTIFAFSPTSEKTWQVDSSGDWNSAANWLGGVPNAVDVPVTFAGAATAPRTIYSDAAVTAGSLKFDNTNGYQIAGQGSLTLDVSSGSATISVLQGTHKINLPTSLNDNTTATIAAGATLRISDPLTLVGGVTLTKAGDGTLSIEAPVLNAAPATIASAAGVTIAMMDLGSNTSVAVSGGTTNLTVTQHLNALSVSGGTVKVGPGTGTVVSTKSLSISGSGSIDLQNSKLVVDYTGASLLASVKTAIDAGSLTSSQLAAGRAIGYGEASDLFAGPTGSFAGQTVDSTSVVVAYTVTGDASLDGTVNSTDFNLLAGHYGQTASSRWTQGDFDGNGKVNTLDFNVLAGQFGTSLPPSAPSLGSVVPEPAMLSVAVMAAIPMLRARRRK